MKEPDPTTFATELPDIVPCKALEITETLAGPPDAPPAIAMEISIKNFPNPVFSKYAPTKINKKMKVMLRI